MNEIVGIDVAWIFSNAPLEACSRRNDDAIASRAVFCCDFGLMPMSVQDEIALLSQTAPNPFAVRIFQPFLRMMKNGDL